MEAAEFTNPRQRRFFERLTAFFAPDNLAAVGTVELRAEDVLLSSGIKSGTTWTQQILHGLRSRGHMEFEDIHDVFPYLEAAALRGEQPSLDNNFLPRMLETNNGYEDCPRGSKTVVVTRDPSAAVLSAFHYCVGWFFCSEELSLDEFIELICGMEVAVSRGGLNAGQMRHLASWYPHRNDDGVLWLHYEDLKADLPQCTRLLAEFIGADTEDAALMEIVERQVMFCKASLEFMKANASKFDSHSMKLARNEAAGLPKYAGIGEGTTGKVRTGLVKEYEDVFSPKAKEIMKRAWTERLKPVTGYDSYAEMRAAINAELGRFFQA